MTPRPNALGYLVLAGFAAAAVYAVAKSARAQEQPEPSATVSEDCPITEPLLRRFQELRDVAIAYFPELSEPPVGELVLDDRVYFPTIEAEPAKAVRQPLVLITGDGRFWRYDESLRAAEGTRLSPVPSPDDRDAYCELAAT